MRLRERQLRRQEEQELIDLDEMFDEDDPLMPWIRETEDRVLDDRDNTWLDDELAEAETQELSRQRRGRRTSQPEPIPRTRWSDVGTLGSGVRRRDKQLLIEEHEEEEEEEESSPMHSSSTGHSSGGGGQHTSGGPSGHGTSGRRDEDYPSFDLGITGLDDPYTQEERGQEDTQRGTREKGPSQPTEPSDSLGLQSSWGGVPGLSGGSTPVNYHAGLPYRGYEESSSSSYGAYGAFERETADTSSGYGYSTGQSGHDSYGGAQQQQPESSPFDSMMASIFGCGDLHHLYPSQHPRRDDDDDKRNRRDPPRHSMWY